MQTAPITIETVLGDVNSILVLDQRLMGSLLRDATDEEIRQVREKRMGSRRTAQEQEQAEGGEVDESSGDTIVSSDSRPPAVTRRQPKRSRQERERERSVDSDTRADVNEVSLEFYMVADCRQWHVFSCFMFFTLEQESLCFRSTTQKKLKKHKGQ